MVNVTSTISIPDEEVTLTPIRSQGPGGQNVNKVATAVHLRFDIHASSLPEQIKQLLFDARDRRITRDGVVVIKAQRFRSQERNREDAIRRLGELVTKLTTRPKSRTRTRPPRSARKARLESKARRSGIKRLRSKVIPEE